MPGPAAFRTLKENARNLVSNPPQVVRELPGRTVRVAVIGVGRALLLADRARVEYSEVRREGVGSTVARLRSEGISAFGRGATAAPDTAPAEQEPATAETPGPPMPEPTPAPDPIAADLPVPNYDDLSVASLRARLRNLSVDQVKVLRDYEEAHANRESVVTMYDNRIAKLRGEPPSR